MNKQHCDFCELFRSNAKRYNVALNVEAGKIYSKQANGSHSERCRVEI